MVACLAVMAAAVFVNVVLLCGFGSGIAANVGMDLWTQTQTELTKRRAKK
jgi:hypothetical protein